jgi:hypothetical protein
MSCHRLLFSKAEATVRELRRLLDTLATRSGANYDMDWPSSQASTQNLNLVPSSNTTIVEAHKNAVVSRSSITGKRDQGQAGSHCCSHS